MTRSILVADDSVTIRRVVELAFSDTDIRVESAGNGAEAIAKFAALAPDVVLADVVMPEPDGYAICRVVKSSERPVRVLLLAGTFEPLDPDRWTYEQMARDCRARNIVPVWVYLPATNEKSATEEAALLMGTARAAGFVVLDLGDVYRGNNLTKLSSGGMG